MLETEYLSLHNIYNDSIEAVCRMDDLVQLQEDCTEMENNWKKDMMILPTLSDMTIHSCTPFRMNGQPELTGEPDHMKHVHIHLC